jgi:hypothetical protein
MELPVYNNALSGLKLIVTDEATVDYAGVDRNGSGYNGFWDAVRIDGSEGLSLDMMTQMKQDIMSQGDGEEPTLVVTSAVQWRQYANLLYPDRRWVDKVKRLDGGFQYLDFDGMPIVWDKDCDPNRMYFLNEKTMAIEEQTPLRFMDRDGAILVRVGAGDTAEDAYELTCYTRAELASYNCANHGVIYDLPTTVG